MTALAGQNVTHSARVAAIATVLIAAVYILAVGALDVVVNERLSVQVKTRVAEALAADASLPLVISHAQSIHSGQDPDDVPVLVWQVDAHGRSRSVTAGAPALPTRVWSPTGSVTLSLGPSTFDLQARKVPGGGWLVAGESLADVRHVRSILLSFETVVGPIMLLAIFLGSWVVGLSASAPIERTRRRQLDFAADASHELRTPLSVIEAEVGLALTMNRPASDYRASLERVSGEGRRLRRIVEDLLWLARFDSEPPPPGEEPVDVSVIASSCSDRFKPVAEARLIHLSVDCASEPPALIKAPPEWVDRLIGVLVDNACRYTPKGGSVKVSVSSGSNRVGLIVEDSGPGIPPAERDRLFDRFHRLSDQQGGAGLGLAIADSVVQSTGGHWRVGDSRLGGARMEVDWHRAGPAERLSHRRGRQGPGRPESPLEAAPRPSGVPS
ncbi:MAG TPA: HAMP domain-containing sensor histidine kinase [Acidimicrobiales bacterium]|nr:HAMP domain-containing sensor histidine kinase [Acidimicrobiales bacterium]